MSSTSPVKNSVLQSFELPLRSGPGDIEWDRIDGPAQFSKRLLHQIAESGVESLHLRAVETHERWNTELVTFEVNEVSGRIEFARASDSDLTALASLRRLVNELNRVCRSARLSMLFICGRARDEETPSPYRVLMIERKRLPQVISQYEVVAGLNPEEFERQSLRVPATR